MHFGRLAGEDVVVPGVGRCFQEFGKAILGVPEGLIEEGGQCAVGAFADAAHVAVAGFPHDFENCMLAAEAVGVSAGRGEAVYFAPEGVFDQLSGVAKFIGERGPVLAQLFQVGMGEGVALDVEEGMV